MTDSEDAFTFVTKKKHGRRPPPNVVNRNMPHAAVAGVSQNRSDLLNTKQRSEPPVDTRKVGPEPLPGWSTRKPTKFKGNSQRAKMMGYQSAKTKKDIAWAQSTIDDRLFSLKDSKFYLAFQDLVLSTLLPPHKPQRTIETDPSMIQQSTAAPSETDSEDSIAGGPNNTNDQLDNCNLPENFEPIEDIICYGIGSIESSRNSQFQLALGICLKEALQVKGTLSIFDPIMTDLDKELAEKLGCRVLEQNDQSYVGIKTRTLFYMPHCPKGLYSQILESNWTSECLSRIVIIGNRFTMYDESPLFRQIERQAPFILPALSIASVSPFPVEKFEDNTVFNDLAIHTFSPKTADLPAVSLEDREQDPEML